MTYLSGQDSSATHFGMELTGIESRCVARFSAPVKTGPVQYPTPCTIDQPPPHLAKVKLKVPRIRPEGPDWGSGIALLFLDIGTRRMWVVSTTPR
jgi:hypothetical protein